MHIGIVEGRPKFTEMIKEGLEKSGNITTLYENGQEALQCLLETRFQNVALPIDILILDSETSSHLKVITRLRQFITADVLPIILLFTDPCTLPNLDIRLVSKPISSSNLQKEVEEAITDKR